MNVSKRKNGFTLVEILVVMGILVLVAATSAYISMENWYRSSIRGEAEKLVSTLQTARAYSLNNVNEQMHGVAFEPDDYSDGYVLFEGESYDDRDPDKDIFVDRNYKVNVAGASEIVFKQLSAVAISEGENFDGDILISDRSGRATTTIKINREGAITW